MEKKYVQSDVGTEFVYVNEIHFSVLKFNVT